MIEEQVKRFIAEQTCTRIEKLSLKTELLEDLGVDGDDAFELLQRFSEEFKVDLSTFQFDQYFGSEGGADLFVLLASIIFGKNNNLKSVTIEDLVSAALAKRWLKN